MDHRYGVVIAGGSGTRFWPESRGSRPKQFLSITGAGKPLIALAHNRLRKVLDRDRVFVVAGVAHRDQILAALPDLPPGNLITEPVARNTAPAIGLAAAYLSAQDPAAVLAVVPADQHIGDEEAFARVLSGAFDCASGGNIVTLGITPSRPETGYGYIRKGASIGSCAGFEIFGVEAFVEKPDRAKAIDYVMSGRYLWNAGMFIFRSDTMLREMERHLPEVSGGLKAISAAVGTPALGELTEKVFSAMPSISIDYGVMEKVGGIRVIPASIAWSDVGSWASLYEVSETDPHGNVVSGETVLVDVERSVVKTDSQFVAAVGLRNTAVVVTRDAVLVCPLDRTQDVRKVVEELKTRGRKDLL